MVLPKILGTAVKPASAKKTVIKMNLLSTIARVATMNDARHATTTPLENEGALQELELANIK